MTRRWPWTWRWPVRRRARAEAKQSEEAAAYVHAELVIPLRKMREANHLTEAVAEDMKRRYGGEGGDS